MDTVIGKVENKHTVLVVEDDEMIVLMVTKMLLLRGYNVIAARDGEIAMRMVHEKRPDVVILDINIPEIDGFEVCRRIKEEMPSSNIPVLMLTAMGDTNARVKGLGIGADDYMVKPFNYDELIARVQSVLRRSKMGLDANPLTHLPGNNQIEQIIIKNIKQNKDFALLYIDLNSFKAYNDYYGFPNGDDVLRATAHILQDVMTGSEGFLGHIGGDDFVIFTAIKNAEPFCKEIIKRFDSAVPGFYKETDSRQGYIQTINRKGKTQKFSLLSIAIGVVINLKGSIDSIGKISMISAELKKFAKSRKKSSYAIDRRNRSR